MKNSKDIEIIKIYFSNSLYKKNYLDWCHKISTLSFLNDFCNLNNLKELHLCINNIIDF